MQPPPFVIGITGASSVIYGIRLLETLARLGQQSHLVLSAAAKTTIPLETTYSIAQVEALASKVWDAADFTASIASGSFLTQGMVVLPASMKSVAALAMGYDDNLLTRAAGVQLKEGRKLVVCPRETPLTQAHLKNLLALAQMGAVILPCLPAFYHQPQTLDEVINHSLGKILDQFGIQHTLFRRWGQA